MTAEVEPVLVAPTQPEGDVSSAGVLELQEAEVESWTTGPCMARVKSWVPRWA
jgi:hypothetical protein